MFVLLQSLPGWADAIAVIGLVVAMAYILVIGEADANSELAMAKGGVR